MASLDPPHLDCELSVSDHNVMHCNLKPERDFEESRVSLLECRRLGIGLVRWLGDERSLPSEPVA